MQDTKTNTVSKIIESTHKAEIVEVKKTKIQCKSNPYIFGRPSKYCPILCRCLVEYFDQEPTTTKEIKHYKNGELAWTDLKEVPNRIPTLTRFAKDHNIGWVTIHEWIDPNEGNYKPDFANAYQHARAVRKSFLCDSAVIGHMPPNTFKFIAVNLTDMRDRQEVDRGVTDELGQMLKDIASNGSGLGEIEGPAQRPLLADK